MNKIDPKKLGQAIKTLRQNKDLSQEQLAQALDIPRPSLTHIEKGTRDLSIGELHILLEIFQISYEELIQKMQSRKKQPTPKKTQKFTPAFNPDKFKQLLLYILKKCGGKPNVGETVLYKLLYFCDFDYFERYEKPLTGMPYKRLQFGPVPDQKQYNLIIQEMINDGHIKKVRRPYVGETIQTKYVTFSEPDMHHFAPQEIELIDRVIHRLSDMSARQIEDHAHRDYPWQAHQNGELINYLIVFERSGEFAQRDYDAEFLQVSAKDTFGSLPDLTRKEYDYYMNLPHIK